ncbi:tetratricopeptide repeat protein 23-like isoform X2 [Solea senegalensis]|uniref:Tetratricopeptide repeat protein 23-like isoform X2 n=1 Tax=Solea senegalensis TaxID=28829 RepID=A0AAV6T0R4_SOLSE|nr:tetratricopeptide repeat protein 23 isoform X1 [Solea senegalensis]KAG7523028.1 tetratricopeptide repeat protein 23-like isoform X2 [Solea senegalensis]
MEKTRPSSAEGPESSGSLDEASRCGSHASSSSKTGYIKRDFMMMAPEEKLKHFDSQAQVHEDNQEFNACIQDLVRCVALTRLVYGDGHLKRAQAHARLAKAYFQFKGWGLQAREHAASARELLPHCSSISSCSSEKQDVRACLLSINLTQGGAALLTTNLDEAESSFLEAEQVLKDLHQHNAIDQEEETRTALEISSSLCRVYRRQNRHEEALRWCEKSLHLLKECDKPEKTCTVYRDMAAIEQDKGHLDQAIEHLSKAHAVAMSHSLGELEAAQISHSLALVLSAAAESHHNDVDSTGHYFEQSLSAYENSVGAQDPAFISAQDDFCRFLLLNGQQERCVEIQRSSLPLKRSTFGDLSTEVADTLQLIGSVEMTEGRMVQAHRTMTKCLEIQSWTYGPQHKRTKTTQKAVDMLARAPEVAERLQRLGRRKI